MQAVIFIGIQACGKSTFYKESFVDTHIRINLDMLKTRHREKLILDACIAAKQSFVIDNTNPCIADRKIYIEAAARAGFEIVAYYFKSDIAQSFERNKKRKEKAFIPEKAILCTFNKLELPSYSEGFNKIYYVEAKDQNKFFVDNWKE